MIRFETALGLLFLLSIIPLFYVIRKRHKAGIRDKFAAVLRSLVILFLSLSVAGVSLQLPGGPVNLIIIADRSYSMGDEDQLIGIMEDLQSNLPRDTRIGLVSYGANAVLESAPKDSFSARFTAEINRDGSNLEDALYTAYASFPAEGDRRILILSDGLQTEGNALEAAEILKARGIEIYSLAVGNTEESNEVFIKNIDHPRKIRENESHEFMVQLSSNVATNVVVTMYRDGEYLGEEELTISPGDTMLRYEYPGMETGIHRYDVLISPWEDTVLENNRWESAIIVGGGARVLLVSKETNPAFLQALEVQGFPVTVSRTVPQDLLELSRYLSIILDNIPAYDLSFSQMQNLSSWVRDTGGGLFMIGGDESYGVGGYYRTPLEEILPLDMDVNSPLNIPSLSMTVLVDKSGSMANIVEGSRTKLDLVKEAILSAVDILNPYYQIALLAFDIEPDWVIPMTQAGDVDTIRDGLANLGAGGGTILFPAMEAALENMKTMESGVKHVVILSDGLTTEADFEKVTREMVEARISVSTIAVGEDADQVLMRDIAVWGNGRAYHTDSFANVPRIFASESLIVSRGLIQEEDFIPTRTGSHPSIEGLEAFPPLRGYVLTYPKASASIPLTGPDGSPLYAVWQHGLGRAAAFTSDMEGLWSEEWLRWPELPKFLDQVISYVTPVSSGNEPNVDFTFDEGLLKIKTDVRNPDGSFQDGLSLNAILSTEDGNRIESMLVQEGPGLYSASFPYPKEGIAVVTIDETAAKTARITLPISRPYPREYTSFGLDSFFLESLESSYQIADPDPFVRISQQAGRTGTSRSALPLWPLLTILALLLFIGDIALRWLSPELGEDKEPDLDELKEIMTKRRKSKARRDLSFWFGDQSKGK
jgi:uncharacterized membrane protein